MLNNTTLEKILGSVLLIAGLSLIGAGLYLGVNIFFKAQPPPEIFKPIVTETAKTSAECPQPAPVDINALRPEDIQKLIGGGSMLSPELIKSIIPPEMFNYTSRLMNLTVFSLFLWLLITAGAKIASLGVALVKSNSDIKF